MKRTRMIILRTMAVLAVIFLIYHFFFGRLFPFSPVTVGFNRKVSGKAIVYYRNSDSIPEFYLIDSLIESVEKCHNLHFKHKIKIFMPGNDGQYRRYTGTSARFVTMPAGGRIFISGKAVNDYRNHSIHLETYLKHELSHSLLYQNMTLLRSLRYPGWFMEGLAMYTAGQTGVDGYYNLDQVRQKLSEGYFVEPNDWGTIISSKGKTVTNCPIPDKFHFIYSEYALLINDLIKKTGTENFLKFLKSTLNQRDFYGLFKSTSGQDFDIFLSNYRN